MGVVSNLSAILAVLLLVNVAIEARSVWTSSVDYDYDLWLTESNSTPSLRQNLTLVKTNDIVTVGDMLFSFCRTVCLSWCHVQSR